MSTHDEKADSLVMLSQLTIAGLDGERIAQFRRREFYTAYNRASAGDHMERCYADKIDRDRAKSYAFRV